MTQYANSLPEVTTHSKGVSSKDIANYVKEYRDEIDDIYYQVSRETRITFRAFIINVLNSKFTRVSKAKVEEAVKKHQVGRWFKVKELKKVEIKPTRGYVDEDGYEVIPVGKAANPDKYAVDSNEYGELANHFLRERIPEDKFYLIILLSTVVFIAILIVLGLIITNL